MVVLENVCLNWSVTLPINMYTLSGSRSLSSTCGMLSLQRTKRKQYYQNIDSNSGLSKHNLSLIRP